MNNEGLKTSDNQEKITFRKRVGAFVATARRNKLVRIDAINSGIGAVIGPALPPVFEWLNNAPVNYDPRFLMLAVPGAFVGLLARKINDDRKENAILNQGRGDWGTYDFTDSRTGAGFLMDALKTGQEQQSKPQRVIVDR